jgi:hypothetical protein
MARGIEGQIPNNIIALLAHGSCVKALQDESEVGGNKEQYQFALSGQVCCVLII